MGTNFGDRQEKELAAFLRHGLLGFHQWRYQQRRWVSQNVRQSRSTDCFGPILRQKYGPVWSAHRLLEHDVRFAGRKRKSGFIVEVACSSAMVKSSLTRCPDSWHNFEHSNSESTVVVGSTNDGWENRFDEKEAGWKPEAFRLTPRLVPYWEADRNVCIHGIESLDQSRESQQSTWKSWLLNIISTF